MNRAPGTDSDMLQPLDEDSPHMARVTAAQQLLFPANPRAVCDEMGLNWWAALKLYEDSWLSFSPERTPQLDEAQEAELRFVGALVTAGCDRNMLLGLLCGLAKPYAYDSKRLFYDWSNRRWRLLPDPHADPEALFAEWLEMLAQKGDVVSLRGVGELAQEALSRVAGCAPQQEFRPKPSTVTNDGEACSASMQS